MVSIRRDYNFCEFFPKLPLIHRTPILCATPPPSREATQITRGLVGDRGVGGPRAEDASGDKDTAEDGGGARGGELVMSTVRLRQ